MYGLTRGTMTLLGAAGAGLLLWLASQTDTDSLGGYWVLAFRYQARAIAAPRQAAHISDRGGVMNHSSWLINTA